MERRFLWCCPIRVAVWGRLHCQLAPGAAGWLSLLSHPCHLLGGGGHVPWSLPRLRGCVWPSLENRFPARGREEGADEGLVEVKRQTACRPGEIHGDIPWGMNLGGQQDLCSDLCAFWGAHLPWRWLARARRCSPSPCSLLVAFSIGFVPTDASQGDPRGEEGGGRPAPFLLLLLLAHLPPRCSNNNRRAPGAELEGLWLHRSGTGAVFVPGRGCRQISQPQSCGQGSSRGWDHLRRGGCGGGSRAEALRVRAVIPGEQQPRVSSGAPGVPTGVLWVWMWVCGYMNVPVGVCL